MMRMIQWFLLIILIVLWGGGVLLDRIVERALLDSTRERLMVALQAHQHHLQTILAHQQQDLRLFANGAVGALAEGRTPRLDAAFLSAHLPETIGCTLVDAQGRMVAQTDVPGPSPAEIAAEVSAELSTVHVTDPAIGPSGLPVYDVYLPLPGGVGRLPAKPSVNILACRLNSILSSVLADHRQGLGLSGEVYLVSAKSRLLLTESRFIPDPEAIGRLKVETVGVREAVKRGNGIASYPDYRGVPVLGAFSYLKDKDVDWVLLAEIDESEALAPLSRLRVALGLGIGSISLAVGLVGWWGGRRITGLYAKGLAEQARAQEAEAQITSILAAALDAVFEIDETGTILLANEAAHRLFGWPAGGLIGQNITVIMPPAAQEKHQVGLRRYLDTRESRHIGKVTEVTGCRRDSTLVPCEVSLAVVAHPDGRRAFVGIVRDLTERKRSEEAIHTIEWLLKNVPEKSPYQPPYGDLVSLNTHRVIAGAVGGTLLNDIVAEYLDVLGTSAAVYEQNGDYALGIFSSGWCRALDSASRRLCGTDDNREALACGKWLCHESCWRDASKVSIETGGPVDIECKGGIRLYAVPVRAGDKIIGSMNFGYGNPPTEPRKLQEIAERYGMEVEQLREQAVAYESRPPFIVEHAKERLGAAARLIGEIVRRSRAEAALREAYSEVEGQVRVRTADLVAANEALRKTHDELGARARELQERVDELERFRKATVQREFRIKELKEEVERLKREA